MKIPVKELNIWKVSDLMILSGSIDVFDDEFDNYSLYVGEVTFIKDLPAYGIKRGDHFEGGAAINIGRMNITIMPPISPNHDVGDAEPLHVIPIRIEE